MCVDINAVALTCRIFSRIIKENPRYFTSRLIDYRCKFTVIPTNIFISNVKFRWSVKAYQPKNSDLVRTEVTDPNIKAIYFSRRGDIIKTTSSRFGGSDEGIYIFDGHKHRLYFHLIRIYDSGQLHLYEEFEYLSSPKYFPFKFWSGVPNNTILQCNLNPYKIQIVQNLHMKDPSSPMPPLDNSGFIMWEATSTFIDDGDNEFQIYISTKPWGSKQSTRVEIISLDFSNTLVSLCVEDEDQILFCKIIT